MKYLKIILIVLLIILFSASIIAYAFIYSINSIDNYKPGMPIYASYEVVSVSYEKTKIFNNTGRWNKFIDISALEQNSRKQQVFFSNGYDKFYHTFYDLMSNDVNDLNTVPGGINTSHIGVKVNGEPDAETYNPYITMRLYDKELHWFAKNNNTFLLTNSGYYIESYIHRNPLIAEKCILLKLSHIESPTESINFILKENKGPSMEAWNEDEGHYTNGRYQLDFGEVRSFISDKYTFNKSFNTISGTYIYIKNGVIDEQITENQSEDFYYNIQVSYDLKELDLNDILKCVELIGVGRGTKGKWSGIRTYDISQNCKIHKNYTDIYTTMYDYYIEWTYTTFQSDKIVNRLYFNIPTDHYLKPKVDDKFDPDFLIKHR